MTSTPEPDDTVAAVDAVERGDHGVGFLDGLGHHTFDDVAPGDGLVGVGDPKIMALVLGSLGIVALMVMLLSVVNNGVLSVFTALMLLITAGLGWGATRLARRATPTRPTR